MIWLGMLLGVGVLYVGFLRSRYVRRHPRLLDFSKAIAASLTFPKGFLFGAATAAHQVEGGTPNNNWTRWEDAVRPDGTPGIFTGDRCGDAADHWARFDEDLVRMQDLGLTAYRFSLSWSRLEPQRGQFDDDALARYRSWCEKLQAAGITPMVTLHHFAEPLWITDQGGFENRDTVADFARFVEHVVPPLADVVDHWVTINEPVVFATLGWFRGEFPPGKTDAALTVQVCENLLLAHGEAYARLHALDTADADGDGLPCQVGLAKNIVPFEPRRWWHPGDALAAHLLDRFYNRAVLDLLKTGRYRINLPGLVHHEAHHPHLAGTCDFLGVNHYFRQIAALDLRDPNKLVVDFDPACEKNDMGWDLTPQSFYDALHFGASYGWPLYVTENGTCDAEQPDLRRQRFLTDCLYAAQEACHNGLDLRGYLHWSLMDNFEWAHGFAPRFGLYRVDFETQQRTLTGGGEIYREVLARHRG